MSAQPDSPGSRRKLRLRLPAGLALCLALAAPAGAASPGFSTVGTFSAMTFTEEHQYGSEIRLWRDGTGLVGFFSHAEGLAGDTPTGLLEDLAYDQKSGRLSFSARLTTGLHTCRVHRQVPARDLFRFQGTLSPDKVSGTLERRDALHPEQPPRAQEVVLGKVDEGHAEQPPCASRAEWDAAAAAIMKFRGPRW